MLTNLQIENTTWNYLRSKGLNENSTAAVMGNIYAESGFDPNLVEVGNSIGYGLCQWSYGRRSQLESYGTDLNHQLDFLWSELTGQNISVTGANYQWINKTGYINNVDFMAGNGSINDLTSAFCFCWERPNVDLAHLDVRQSTAQGYFTKYTGTVVTDPTGSGGSNTFIKLKSTYLYGFQDQLFGRKFHPSNNQFTLVSTTGNVSIIKDGEKVYKVPTKNIIK
jgi:hypothetical protein